MSDIISSMDRATSILFDESNPNWCRDPVSCGLFLKGSQYYMNALLDLRGHVLLNDVYDQLGTPRTYAGGLMGWYKEEGSNPVIFEITKPTTNTFLVAFNVDGEMLKRLDG